MNKDFQDFLDTHGEDIAKGITTRVEKDFSGSFSKEELVAKLISEANTTALSYLAHYHDWLISKYDIKLKKQ